MRRVELKKRKLKLWFEPNPAIDRKIKDVVFWTDREHDRGDLENIHWVIRVSPVNCKAVKVLLREYFLDAITPNQTLRDGLNALWSEFANVLEAQAVANTESRLLSTNIIIPGLEGQLRPFQCAGVAYAVKNRRVMLADEMGLGKTVQAIGTIQATGAYPALCITKASLVKNWRREWYKFVPSRNVTSDLKEWRRGGFDVLVLSYNTVSSKLAVLKETKWQSAVADESHLLKNGKSARTKACLDLVDTIEPGTRMALSGTPVEIKPVDLVCQLKFIDRLGDFGGWMPFVGRYCGAYKGDYGWVTDGATHTKELHELLRSTCYIRREKKDVVTELPPKTRDTITLPISNEADYKKADRDVVAYIRDQKPILARADEDDACMVEALARVQVLQKLAVVGMMPAVEEWLEDFFTTGKKLILFAHSVEIQRELLAICRRYTKAVWTREKGPNVEEIQNAIDTFQSDPAYLAIVCSIEGDNAGHNLTAADVVATFELPWKTSTTDQCEDRAHRIGQTGNVTCYYFLAEGTLYEDKWALLNERRKVVEAVTDGRTPDKKATDIRKDLLARISSNKK